MRVYPYSVFISGHKYPLVLWEPWRLLHKYDKDFEWGSNLELMRMVANVHNKANAAKKKTCLQMKIINCYYSYFLNEGDERFDWKLNVKYVSNKIN